MMSSRGRGRGRNNSRGGSGRGRGNSNSSRPSNSNSKELKFSQNVTGASGVAYGTVKDAILRHIQSYYDGGYDIAKSLRDGTKLDLSSSEPRRVISQATDEKVRAIEQDGRETSQVAKTEPRRASRKPEM